MSQRFRLRISRLLSGPHGAQDYGWVALSSAVKVGAVATTQNAEQAYTCSRQSAEQIVWQLKKRRSDLKVEIEVAP